jgi:hypothetical protein
MNIIEKGGISSVVDIFYGLTSCGLCYGVLWNITGKMINITEHYEKIDPSYKHYNTMECYVMLHHSKTQDC